MRGSLVGLARYSTQYEEKQVPKYSKLLRRCVARIRHALYTHVALDISQEPNNVLGGRVVAQSSTDVVE